MPSSEKSKDKSKDRAVKEEGAKKSSKKASGGDLTSSSPKRSSSSAGGKEKSAKTATVEKTSEQPVPAATTVKKAKADGGGAASTGGGGDASPTSATTKKKKKAAENNHDVSPPPQVYQPALQQQQPELYQPASQPSNNQQQDQRQQQQQYDDEYYDEEGDYSGGVEQYGQQQQQQQQPQAAQQQEFPNLPLPEDMKAAAAAEREKKEAADQQQERQQQNQEQPPPAASATTAPPPSTTGSSFMFGGGADSAKDTTGGSTTATAAHQPQFETNEADAAGAAGSATQKEPAGNSSAVGGDHQQETKANDTAKQQQSQQQPASNAVDEASPSSPLSTSSRADSKKKISLKTAGNTVGAALEIKKKWRQKIDAYCMVRVPSMTASDIDAAFEHYGQKENGYEKMWASLTKRFGPELTPLEKERIMWSRKVKNYYALVDPAKTDEDVEKCLQHFEKKENGYEIMWSRLQKRYGVTIPDAGSPEKNAPANAAGGGGGLSAAALAAQNARAASPHHATIRRKSSSPSGRPTMAPLENPLVAAHLAEDAASHLHVPPPPEVEVVQPRVILLVVVAGVSMKLYKNAGPAQQFKFNSAVALEVQRLLRFPENIVVTKVTDYHYANVHVSPHGEVEAGGGILFELETALPTGWSASIVGSTLIGKVLSGGATCAMIRQAYAEELLGNPQRVYIMDAGVVEVRSTPGLRAMLNLSTNASPLASADDQQYLRRGAGGIGTQATVEGGTFVVPKPQRNASPWRQTHHYDDEPTHSQHGYNAQVPLPAPSDRYNAGRLSPRHDAELLQSQLTSASPPANPFAAGIAHHQQQLVVSTTGQHPPAVSGGTIDARRRVPAQNDGIPPTTAEYEPHTPSPVAQNVQRHNPLPTSPTNNGGSGGSRYYDLQGTAATGLQQPAFFGGGTPGGSKAFASPYNRTTVPAAATMNNSPQFDTVTPAPQQAPNQAAASQGSFRPQDVNTTTYLDPLTISPIAPGGANNNTGGGDVTMHQGTTALSPDVGGSRSAMAAHLRRSGTF